MIATESAILDASLGASQALGGAPNAGAVNVMRYTMNHPCIQRYESSVGGPATRGGAVEVSPEIRNMNGAFRGVQARSVPAPSRSYRNPGTVRVVEPARWSIRFGQYRSEPVLEGTAE